MQYEIYGPIELPTREAPNGSRVFADTIKKTFLTEAEKLRPKLCNASGCYVFSVRASKGFKPWYVGRTNNKNGFAGECFQPHKMLHYLDALSQTKKGTPVIHLAARLTNRGKFATPNKRETEFIEQIMIGMALSQNYDLLNTSMTRFFRDLVVPGIIGRPGRGRYNESTRTLRSSLGL